MRLTSSSLDFESLVTTLRRRMRRKPFISWKAGKVTHERTFFLRDDGSPSQSAAFDVRRANHLLLAFYLGYFRARGRQNQKSLVLGGAVCSIKAAMSVTRSACVASGAGPARRHELALEWSIPLTTVSGTSLGDDFGHYFPTASIKPSYDGEARSKNYLHWAGSPAVKDHKAEVSLDYTWLAYGECDGPRIDVHSPKLLLVRSGCICVDIVEENTPKFTGEKTVTVTAGRGGVVYVPMSLLHTIRACKCEKDAHDGDMEAAYVSYFPKTIKALPFPDAMKEFGKIVLTSHFNLKYEHVYALLEKD
ncbi:hypothetical protein FVE85_2970 [Porphyridium purpureum]|uniref:Uncharacterized protein n=1 Tax=Porphyridium purpureum TaxID=35688 RepID=A0A5J4YTB8_PORPP|nr:hypothetical protein FVE85_2970 [Porphyridium purpureum]|eukprot:POR8269..scf227_4